MSEINDTFYKGNEGVFDAENSDFSERIINKLSDLSAGWLDLQGRETLLKNELGQNAYEELRRDEVKKIMDTIVLAKKNNLSWIELTEFRFPVQELIELAKHQKMDEEFIQGLDTILPR